MGVTYTAKIAQAREAIAAGQARVDQLQELWSEAARHGAVDVPECDRIAAEIRVAVAQLKGARLIWSILGDDGDPTPPPVTRPR